MAVETIEGEKADVRVELQWDDYNAGLFADKLLRHVRSGEMAFDMEARTGPPATVYVAAIDDEHTDRVLGSVARYLLRRKRRAGGGDGELPDPRLVVYVGGETREVRLRDEDDVEVVEALARRKSRRAQSDLADF